MRAVHLPGLDLNLLPPLEALLRRRNVTHAAADVGLSQPAMSRALARLRDLFGDPLLVRGHKGLVLTPRAQALAPRLGLAAAGIRDLFSESGFDPAGLERTIRIAASDAQTVLLGPELMRRLRSAAPGVDLRFAAYTPDLIARLEDGSVDLAIALASTPLPSGAMSAPIGDDRLALVMRRGHPLARRRWTLQTYGLVEHASVAILGDGISDLDALLGAAGVRRRIACVAPHFIAALAVVAGTDLVTTISAAFASHFARQFDLVVRPPPFAAAHLPMVAVWSHLRQGDPAMDWFRGLLREASQAAFAPRPRAALSAARQAPKSAASDAGRVGGSGDRR